MMTEIRKLVRLLRFFPFFILSGITAGLFGYAFRQSIVWVGAIRHQFPFLIYFLPVIALVVHTLYRNIPAEKRCGAKSVIAAVKNNAPVSLQQIPLVFIASVLTHLFGGSAGREGAVLEMGGVLGDQTARILHYLDRKGRGFRKIRLIPTRESWETQRQVAILCGMAGAFSALFVTPLAAVFFVLEITDSHQILHRFVPVFFSSSIAFALVCFLGWQPESQPYFLPNPLPTAAFLRAMIVAAGCGIVGRFFCLWLRGSKHIFYTGIHNGYIRTLTASLLIVLFSTFLNTEKFNGLGEETIHAALNGLSEPLDFFWKAVLTGLTLAAGLKGGEIIPAVFVGATFGSSFSSLIGFLPDFGASMGIVAILSAAAKTPIAAFLLGIELFGVEGIFFYAAASAIAYFVSGKTSLFR